MKSRHERPWSEAIIRELRRLAAERGLRQEDIAHAAGISQSTVSRLLTGQQDLCLDHLDQIATALDVKPMCVIERARRATEFVRRSRRLAVARRPGAERMSRRA